MELKIKQILEKSEKIEQETKVSQYQEVPMEYEQYQFEQKMDLFAASKQKFRLSRFTKFLIAIVILYLLTSLVVWYMYRIPIWYLFKPQDVSISANLNHTDLGEAYHDTFFYYNTLDEMEQTKKEGYDIVAYQGKSGIGIIEVNGEAMGIGLFKKNPGYHLFGLQIGDDIDDVFDHKKCQFSVWRTRTIQAADGIKYKMCMNFRGYKALLVAYRGEEIKQLYYVPDIRLLGEE